MLLALVACTSGPTGERVDARFLASVPTPAEGFDVIEEFLPDEGTGVGVASAGLSVADLDGDDRLDLFLPSFEQDQVFFQQEDGSFLLDLEAIPPDLDPGESSSVADYDQDGDLDVFVGNRGIDHLFRNDDGRLYIELGLEGGPYYHVGSTWGDVDLDGDLDLAVLTHSAGPMDIGFEDPGDPKEIWERTEDGWVDHQPELSEALNSGYTYAGGLLDLDGDGLLDLYMVNDFGPLQFPNASSRGDGTFTFVDADDELDAAMYGMGSGVGDLNGDGLPDLLISDWAALHLMLSDGAGDWYDAAVARGLVPNQEREQYLAWGGVFADVDNDGDLDAIVGYGHSPGVTSEDGVSEVTGLPDAELQPDAVYLQHHDGSFEDVGEAWGAAQTGWTRGTVAVDLNRDGAIDVLKRDINGHTTLLLGRPDHDHWLEVVPRRAGVVVGAIVDVEAGGRSWRRWVLAGQDGAFSCGPPEVHVGLGLVDQVDRVRITWPGGDVTEVEDVAADQRIFVDG